MAPISASSGEAWGGTWGIRQSGTGRWSSPGDKVVGWGGSKRFPRFWCVKDPNCRGYSGKRRDKQKVDDRLAMCKRKGKTGRVLCNVNARVSGRVRMPLLG